jgi:putative oxidoreductase
MTKRSFIIFRTLTSTIFIYAGMNHLIQPEKILSKLSGSTVYDFLNSPFIFSLSVMLSGLAMIIGGILLAIGYRQRLAAVVLLLILIPITITVQLESLSNLGPFFKNVAIAGSLLFIINYKQNEMEVPVLNPRIPVR